jgi:hypothetical protein
MRNSVIINRRIEFKTFVLILSIILVCIIPAITFAQTPPCDPIGAVSMVSGSLKKCTSTGFVPAGGGGIVVAGDPCTTLGEQASLVTGAPMYCNNDSPTKHWTAVGGTINRNGFCSPSTGPDNAGTYSCPIQTGYSLHTFRGAIPNVENTFTCCYMPPNRGQGWCSPVVKCASAGCMTSTACSVTDSNYNGGMYSGVQTSVADSRSCCFAPKDTSATSGWCGPMVRADQLVSGCPVFPGFTSKEIDSVTASVGRFFACCFFPN